MELWLLLILGIIGIAGIWIIYSFKVPSMGSGPFKMFIWGAAMIVCLLLYVVHLKGCLNQPIGVVNQTTVMDATILPVDCDGVTTECPE